MSHRHPRADLRAGTSEPEPVQAAGAICWRPAGSGAAGSYRTTGGPPGTVALSDSRQIPTQSDELELLLVRSARWGDWSWPKGKVYDGESLPECAVREVGEETGARIELGVPLPSVQYVMPDGIEKRVSYWAGRVRSQQPRTALADEISHVEWLPAAAALDRLTRPSDVVPVTELLALADAGRLATRPLLIVRHAKARSRAHWDGAEADRTLTSAGRRQARGLAGLLACWQPGRLLSSPWARCMQTLQPYLDTQQLLSAAHHLDDGTGPQDDAATRAALAEGRAKPEVLPLLSEQGLRNDPARISALIADLLTNGADDTNSTDGAGGTNRAGGTLVCTHRPVLEVVVEALARAAEPQARKQLPAGDPWLDPAEVLLAHIAVQRRPNAGNESGQVVQAVERVRAATAHRPR